MPFREAHHAVGAVVKLAEVRKLPIDRLPSADVQALHAGFGPDWADVFDLRRAMARRRGTGMPGPAQVRTQMKRWRKRLE